MTVWESLRIRLPEPYPQTFIPVVRTFPSPASKLATSGYHCVLSRLVLSSSQPLLSFAVQVVWRRPGGILHVCLFFVFCLCCICLSTKLLNKLSHKLKSTPCALASSPGPFEWAWVRGYMCLHLNCGIYATETV